MTTSHYSKSFLKEFSPSPLDDYRKLASFDWKSMKVFFEGSIEQLKLKMHIWETLERDPVFQRHIVQPTTEEMKRITANQLRRYCQHKFLPPETPNLPYKLKTRFMMTVSEALAISFPDVYVKYGIGIELVKNALTTLGTERHQHIADAAWEGKLLACTALTEVAHGSNTKQMRTEATYDPKSEEFVINTPDFEAAKCWVGNLGKSCTLGIVFAQLITGGQSYGLHAFLVPIRDPRNLLPYPGIIVGDMGEKIGLHGVDNGFVMFKDYRIPRENLLNRTGDVSADGEYESCFSEPGKIFGAVLENLSTGRVAIMTDSTNSLIRGITIAVRYSALRKQFGINRDDDKEVPIIEHQLHQWRLFPYVSAASVFKVFMNSFVDDYLTAVEKTTSSTAVEDLSDLVAEVHGIVSSAKPLITWITRDAIQESREACGGHGFLKASGLGDLKGAVDASVTYEGDNNVLSQQTSNWLLRQWEQLTTNGTAPKSPMKSCAFLENYREILTRKFTGKTCTTLLNYQFVVYAYEWLVTWLLHDTHTFQRQLLSNGESKGVARNRSQVYRAAVLNRAFAEFVAIRHFWKKLSLADFTLKPVLERLGLLYSLWSLDKHLAYFYQGGFSADPQFNRLVKDSVLDLCASVKNDAMGVIDALAPPDFVVNSILGKSDGKLYENIQSALFNHPGAFSRPDWWSEIAFSTAAASHTIEQPKCKL